MCINLSLEKQGQMQNKIKSVYLNQGYELQTEIFFIKIGYLNNFDLNHFTWLYHHQQQWS